MLHCSDRNSRRILGSQGLLSAAVVEFEIVVSPDQIKPPIPFRKSSMRVSVIFRLSGIVSTVPAPPPRPSQRANLFSLESPAHEGFECSANVGRSQKSTKRCACQFPNTGRRPCGPAFRRQRPFSMLNRAAGKRCGSLLARAGPTTIGRRRVGSVPLAGRIRRPSGGGGDASRRL